MSERVRAMNQRDLAEAIHHELISPDSVADALEIWRAMPLKHPEWDEKQRLWFLLASTSDEATETVLARGQREAASTGPWEGSVTEEEWRSRLASQCGQTLAARHERDEERERCAREIEALAREIRDHGPKTHEGLLTALCGAQVGILFDAAAHLRGG